jgi:hypothetical protein
MDAREEMTDAPEMQQWNKGPRLNGTVASEEWWDISRIFRKTVELEIEK